MITNVPSSTNYDEISLRQYYMAWTSIAHLIDSQRDIKEMYFDDAEFQEEEIQRFQPYVQPTLQNCYATLQNACELKMKSLVCEVSPYLLIKNFGRVARAEARNIDFSEIQSVDAAQLPSVVNSACPQPIDIKTIQLFSKLCGKRNKVIHYGSYNDILSVDEAATEALDIYVGLWKDANWLNNMLKASQLSSKAVFHDGEYASPEREIFDQMDVFLQYATGARFRRLTGFSRRERRFVCLRCRKKATLDVGYPEEVSDDIRTTFLVTGENDKNLFCILCRHRFSIIESKCRHSDCKSIIRSNDHPLFDVCHLCCRNQIVDEVAASENEELLSRGRSFE